MTDITFASLGLSEELLGAIAAEGFTAPTDIQREGVPALRSGRDVILQAQTGTGKTAAFVFPIVDDMTPNPGVVEVLVLVPTRELAQQVSNEFEKFGGPRGIRSTAIYGGASFEKQYTALETCQVVVATPGRLLDLHRRKKIKLNSVKHFGLDESDEMLSMGFEKDVMDVVAFLPEGRQSFLCSATYNEDIKRVARAFINDPIIVDVSSDQIGAQSVQHEYVAVSLADKLTAVRRLIDTWASDGAIVFCNTRAATFRVYETLLQEDVSVDVLNGELSQSEREKALGRMRADEIRFLVATDVAARGIDISGLPAVVNYDMPESPDVYIHRTGRTGRAGQAGVAYSLVTPADISVFHALHKFYKLELHEVSLPNPNEVLNLKADRVLDAVLENLDGNKDLPYAIHIPIAARLASRPGGDKVIAKLIAFYDQASAGAATTISELKAFARPSTTAEADTPEEVVTDADELDDYEPAERHPRRRTAPKARVEEEPKQEKSGRDARSDEDVDEKPRENSRRDARSGEDVDEKPRRESRPRRSERDNADTREEPPRKARAERPERDESEEDFVPPVSKSAGKSEEGDEMVEWLGSQPSRRSRGRWRSVNAIAESLELDHDDTLELLTKDDRVEESRNRPGSWRVLRDFLPADHRDARGRGGSRDEERPRREERSRDEERGGRDEERPRREERRPKSSDRPKRDADSDRKKRPDSDKKQRGDSEKKPARAKKEESSPFAKSGPFTELKLKHTAEEIGDPMAFAAQLVEIAGFELEDLGGIDVKPKQTTLKVVEMFASDFADAVHGAPLGDLTIAISRPRRRR